MPVKTARKTLYSPHPSMAMVESSMRKLLERTGKSADAWVAIARKQGPPGEKERREWLKTAHGFTTNYAWWIAELSVGKGRDNTDPDAYLAAAEGYVEKMFAGKREVLRPLYDTLLKLGLATGKDVKACPCQTMVPLYRHHVFAQIKPSTNTRIDMGFALGDRTPTRRLIDTGGFARKDRITHKIDITSPDDIDAEVVKWLKTAYEMDAQ